MDSYPNRQDNMHPLLNWTNDNASLVYDIIGQSQSNNQTSIISILFG